jgi:hypothetical protein
MFSKERIVYGLSRACVTGGALLLLPLLMTASASAQETTQTPSAKHEGEVVKLVVENHNYLDMHVYAMRDGIYRSLGVVTGLSEAEFSIPQFMTRAGTDFEILADPIGSNLSYLTGPIFLGSANEINLSIQGALEFSSFTVFNRGPGAGSGSTLPGLLPAGR